MVRSCAAYGCNNRYDKTRPDIHFYCFPFSRPEICKKWIAAVQRKNWSPTKSNDICSEHFLPEDFEPQLIGEVVYKKLKPDAVPSKFNLPLPLKKQRVLQQSFHQLEEMEDLHTKWKKATPSSKKELINHKIVCMHFEVEIDEGTEQSHFSKLESTYLDITKEEKPTLKPDAVPKIFYNLQTDFSKDILKENKSKIQDCGNHISETNHMSSNISDGQKVDSFTEIIPITEESFSYQILLAKLSFIKKPNDWWTISPCFKFVVCAKWNNDCNLEKRVIIEDDLTVKVFLEEMEVDITSFIEITSVDDISLLLEKVESYKISTS